MIFPIPNLQEKIRLLQETETQGLRNFGTFRTQNVYMCMLSFACMVASTKIMLINLVYK